MFIKNMLNLLKIITMKLPQKALLLLSAVLLSFTSVAKEIYVSKTGDDSNAGTKENPFETIGKAASVAVAGDVIFIRQGTYEETLRPANSGTAGNPIVFRSYPGEKVIITAMEALSGWVNDSGAVYKTTIGFNSLGQENFVLHDDTALDLARWPNNIDGLPFTLDSKRNDGGSDGSDATFNGGNGFLTSTEIPNIDWTGGSLFFYGDRPGSGWLAWKEFITSSSGGRVNFNITKNNGLKWIYTFHPPADEGDFYLEGVKGALDYQNEWWYDSTTKELFVQLPGGVVPADGSVKMRRRRLAIDLNGRSYIEVRDLAVLGGAIELRTNSNNNKLYRVSSFYGYHTQGIFSGFSAGKASVEVNGTRNVIEQCEIAFGAATGMRLGGTFNELKNNYIHDFGYLASYDAPLIARGGSDYKILNNTIFNGGRDAINYNGQRCEIAFNDVSRSNLLADDCGLFYTVGNQSGNEIHHNWFHDAEGRGKLKKAAGVYLDNDPKGFSVHHNVIWNTEWTGVQMNWDAVDIDIFNNTFYNNKSGEMGAWHKAGTAFSNVKVWNNLGDNGTWEPQSDKQNNLVVASGTYANSSDGDFRLNSGSAPIDQGREITGITDGFAGANPDIGAYEFGGTDWTAGIDWDPKKGPTGQGCYGLPGETCEVTPVDDSDKDGVSDANDLCPDTPIGDTVDVNGCTVFTLPTDNFKVLSTGESCKNSDNGSISIEATANYTYTATIQENNMTSDFTDNITFDNLSQGEYTVCVTIGTQPEYKQCFSIVINEPEDLAVFSRVDSSKREISLDLKGGELYRIVLNDEIIMTDRNEVTLKLQSGKNELIVTTDKDCQGVHKESINVEEFIKMFPNPMHDVLNITVPRESSKNLKWELFSYRGKRILQGKQKDDSSNITIDVSNLTMGSYFIKISTSNEIKYEQLIKN
ncbi:T9SS C-terminal target domain-containing protein [Aquimarina sp. AD10]|nr:T9SS C-terminal target domain-containing protein [Aquimarina sp. AD10]RKN01628.1 T9SS C-terminal target domain-containing protein [Aquimarina sp. AD10]